MAYRSSDLLGEGTNATQGASTLSRILGGWGTVTGPSSFMLKAIVIGRSSTVFPGLTSGMIGSLIFGTASVPFPVMSSLDFVVGVTRWYGVALRQALLQLDRFPALLRLHMDANYPTVRFRYKPLEYFQHESFNTRWRMQSMLVTGWLTAQGAIDETHAAEEHVLIEEAAQAVSSARTQL